MKIVVVDCHTLNPGDLSWEPLERLGTCEFYERSSDDQIIPRCKDAQIILTNKALVVRKHIEKLPELKYIGVTATGYNNVDIQAAKERGIVVTNVPTYGTASVAQMAFAHILNLTQHVGHHAQTVRHGRWNKAVDFCYWDYPLIELVGLTLGVVGFGRIGQASAKLGQAFGMKILAHDVFVPDPMPEGVEMVSLERIFSESDILTLHCPLTAENYRMVNARNLALMKPTAFLINTSRGQLVNEQDLLEALNSGRIAGAGLDVLEEEPPKIDHPLFKARNCFITPHIAWATRSARSRMLATTVENIEAYLAGKPQNVVNK